MLRPDEPLPDLSTHLAPNGRDRHPGRWKTCDLTVCVNDREDDAVALTPDEIRAAGIEWHPAPVPLRGDNGQAIA